MSFKAPFFSLLTFLFLFTACEPAPENSEDSPVEILEAATEIVEAANNIEAEKDTVADLWEHLAQVTLPKLPGEMPDFSGSYQLMGEDGGYYFTVELEQQQDTLIGTYCGGTDTRSDCGMPSQGAGDCEVRGIVKQGVGYLVFRSCYSGMTGLAKIRKTGAHVNWETTEYPVEDGVRLFCAAPSQKVLLNKNFEKKYDFPARFDSFEVRSTNFMMDLPHADSQYIYLEARVFNDAEMASFQGMLYGGKPVQIIREAGEYMLSNYGDETFEAPIYEVAFEQYGQEFTGFVYHEDLAQAHFKDNRGNLLLLGLKAEQEIGDRDLEWCVQGDAFGFVLQSAGFKALNAQTNAYFPAYDFSIRDREDLAYGNFSFFEMEINPYQDGLHPVFLWAWDGKKLVQVLQPGAHGTPVQYEAERNSNLLTLNVIYRKSGENESQVETMYEMGGEIFEEFTDEHEGEEEYVD